MSNLATKDIKRVVVRGVNWVGDAVMAIPALRALRRVLPDAHITLATRAWAAGLFADADFIDELLPYQPSKNIVRDVAHEARAWRKQHFDLALLLPNSFATAATAFAARVPVRLGYAADGRRMLLTHPVPRPAWRGERPEIFYYLHLVGALEQLLTGRQTIAEEPPLYQLNVSETRQQQARSVVSGQWSVEPKSVPRAVATGLGQSSVVSDGKSGPHPLIVFCPGSTNSRAKRWPTGYYAQLGDLLAENLSARIVLIGAADEIEISQKVAAQMRQPVLNLTGKTKLAESVALLSVADALISNDTGPAHIAAALGRPTFVIFGPTEPKTTRPYGPSVEIIREPPECAPCMLRDCPIDHRCMTAVTPARIAALVTAKI